MAKSEEIKEIKSQDEKFSLSDKVRVEGYRNTKLGILIDFEKDFDGKRKSRYASSGEIVSGEFKASGLDYLTGLTPEQVYILGTAGVIKIKKSQRPIYVSYLNSIKRTNIDD